MSDCILVNIVRTEAVPADVLKIRLLGAQIAPISLRFCVEAFQLVTTCEELLEHQSVLDADGKRVLDADGLPKFEVVKNKTDVVDLAPNPVGQREFTIEGETWAAWGVDTDDEKYIGGFACAAMGVTREVAKKKKAKKKAVE